MSSIRTPVGPQPPAVYWRRRLFVALGIVAVLIVIILLVVRPGSTPAGQQTPAPSDAAAAPSGTPTPDFTSASNACDPSTITVEAVTDAAEYAAGVQPQVSMKITNTGTAPCTIDVGTAAQEYIVTSGDDRIWSSKDCQTAPASAPTPFNAGETKTTTPFPWDRTRSSTDTCTSERTAAVADADGPTYRLQVKLGDIESATVAFRLFG